MATRLYMRNAVLTAKIETTEGTDASPTGTSNAILVSDMSINPLEGSEVSLAYIRPYFGASPSIRVQDYVTCSFTIDVAGAGTAGTAPAYGPLLRACGFAQTLTASAVTGTATAGAASSITLAAGATDDMYVGATVSITSGTGNGQSRIITDYVASTKVATVHKAWDTNPASGSAYSISANAAYTPVSSSFESLTLYYNVNGVRHKLTGAKGSVSFTMTAKERPSMTFNFTGVYNAVADASEDTPVYTAFQIPAPINSANTIASVAGKLTDGSATGIQMQTWTLDMANAVTHRQLVGQESVILTDRAPAGSLSIEATTMAFKNWFEYVRTSSNDPMFVENGTVAGNIVNIYCPKLQLTTPAYADSDGITMLNCNTLALPNVANDEVRIVVK